MSTKHSMSTKQDAKLHAMQDVAYFRGLMMQVLVASVQTLCGSRCVFDGPT